MSSIETKSKSRLLGFRVDGTGTAALIGSDASEVSLTDNGTGDYSITMSSAFKGIPIASALPLTDDVNISLQADSSSSVIRFECRSAPVAEASASVTFDSAIKFHSQLVGADGNDITIQMADAVTAGSEAIASVSDAGVIVINVEGGVSTATQVMAAIQADTAVAQSLKNFVSAEVLVGATVIATAAATNLAGGVDPVPAAAVDCEFDVILYGLE